MGERRTSHCRINETPLPQCDTQRDGSKHICSNAVHTHTHTYSQVTYGNTECINMCTQITHSYTCRIFDFDFTTEQSIQNLNFKCHRERRSPLYSPFSQGLIYKTVCSIHIKKLCTDQTEEVLGHKNILMYNKMHKHTSCTDFLL